MDRHSVKLICCIFTTLGLIATNLFAQEGPEYAILKSIKAPQDLLFPHFPPRYCVQVQLSGPVAEEMTGAINKLQFESPVFRESFNGKEFNLYLANSNYPEQTRELLSGLLNPLELINMAVESVIKYKSENKFAELQDQTSASHEISSVNGRPVYKIRLIPKGNYFSYSYNDNGAFVEESWMKELTAVVDSALSLVYELSATKQQRQFSVDAVDKPSARESAVKYIFSYEFGTGVPLPSRMEFFSDGEPVLDISAVYGPLGDQIVFTRKTICVYQGSEKACLELAHTDYSCKACPSAKKRNPRFYNRKLEKAALLSKKAVDQLRNGNISVSTRVLEELVEKYGDTPQAVEARRLLAKLPSQLR
ncbi:MAG: hypothetical protein GX556_05170 [Fibrobacter sp.]|jgi:hypothetical protein|nr:hypothetical protein [Fibrobacter sp.]